MLSSYAFQNMLAVFRALSGLVVARAFCFWNTEEASFIHTYYHINIISISTERRTSTIRTTDFIPLRVYATYEHVLSLFLVLCNSLRRAGHFKWQIRLAIIVRHATSDPRRYIAGVSCCSHRYTSSCFTTINTTVCYIPGIWWVYITGMAGYGDK